ncbi:DUF4142 domain-containing protein [Thalassobius sp. S69A]|uniref:DUF4142 domain-containing protein n=1 Tax=unclassified Thalassovita TaxID=2619711 RepID=UPI003C798EC7
MKRKFLGSVVALALAAPVYAGEMLSDAQIIGIYSQVNSFDIETALLGELKGHSDDVRAIGSMVSGDHSGVRQAIHQLASEMGVQPVLPPARIEAAQDHDTVIMQLRGLEGAAFDAAYLRHEIAFHTAAIQAVEGLLIPEAEDPRLRAHFQAVLPAFYHHLEVNQKAAGTLGVSVD